VQNNKIEKNVPNEFNKIPLTSNSGRISERSQKDWREWWTIKRQRNEELLKYTEKNNVRMVRELLNKQIYGDLIADVNTLNPSEMTPLHVASKLGHLEIVNILCENVVDLECKTKTGKTPLHYACQYNRPQIIKLFLS